MISKVGKNFPRVHILDQGAFGNPDFHDIATLAVKVFTFSVDAVASNTVRMVTKSQERGHIAVCDHPHIATLTTVAAIWAAHSLRTFATKRHTACSAVTGPHI